VFFLVFYNTFTGVQSVDDDLINIVRTMGATRRQVVMKVMVPSALLWVFTGLRISIPYALIGAVVGEVFASNAGIGYLINSSAAQFDTAGVFAGLAILTALASLFTWLLGWIERNTTAARRR
jgi:NitT/TauT family transport system permease protein